ncbi:N-acetylmuramoyl-L-alanine amidase [Lysinibacillus fusiformis]
MITISPGHWREGSGAKDLIDEVVEARRVVARVVEILKIQGVSVTQVQDDESTSQLKNLSFLVRQHNKTRRKVDVSVHFNAIGGRIQQGIGTEVLFYDAVTLATAMSKAISHASGLKNRGAKQRKELTFLNATTMPAIMIELCFVNSVADVNCYKQHFEAICRAIATTLADFIG